MKSWNEFIEYNLKEYSDILVMIANYEELQSVGSIGPSMLRNVAVEWIENLGIRVSVTTVMQDIATECYKTLAYRYIDIQNNTDIEVI